MSLDINSSSICIGDKINNEAKRFQKMKPLNGVEGYDFTLFDDASYCNYKTVDLGSFYRYYSNDSRLAEYRIWKKELMPQDLLTKLKSNSLYDLTELTCTGIFITLGNKTYLIPRFLNSTGVVSYLSTTKKSIFEYANKNGLGTPSGESAYTNSDLNIARRSVSLFTKEYFSFNYNITIPNMELMHYLAHNYSTFFNAGSLSLLPTNTDGLYNIAASVYSYGVEIAKADSVKVHNLDSPYTTDTNTIYILPVIEL
jgi:uncharacterized protein YaaQ